MYFLAIFPALVWIGAYSFRRRWPAFVIVASGFTSAVAITSAVGMMTSAPAQAGVGVTIFHLFGYAYCAVVTLVGLMIACTRRTPVPVRCHRCRYDLTGNESGLCPECGFLIEPPAPAKVTVVYASAWAASRRARSSASVKCRPSTSAAPASPSSTTIVQ